MNSPTHLLAAIHAAFSGTMPMAPVAGLPPQQERGSREVPPGRLARASDEYGEDPDLRGAVRLDEVGRRRGAGQANANTVAEFKAERDRTRKPVASVASRQIPTRE